MDSGKTLIVVIGAGVIGLQTSIALLEAGYQVVIVGAHFPGDESIEYTSPWAGAHWRSHADESDREQQYWDTQTYEHWLSVIEKEKNDPKHKPLSGLGLRKSRYYSTSPEPPWFAHKVLSYEQIPEDSLAEGMQHGHTYTSVMVNVPQYLRYLYDNALSLGAIDVRATLPHFSSFSDTLKIASALAKARLNELGYAKVPEKLPEIAAFVNATGISSLKLVPDPNVYPIRGQTITVAGEANQITTISAFSSKYADAKTPMLYILPRPHSNTTILGGTKQSDDWNGESEPQTTEEILFRAKEWAPELLNSDGEFEVLSVQVGHRPARKGGARVEIDRVDGLVVCHAYGHSGAGYQNSVGSANKVIGLFHMWFQTYPSE